MPRNVSDIYSYPAGTEGFPDTTIESEKYNNYILDVQEDLNRPRPIVAGGTGANDAEEALANLGGEKSSQQVTNYDTHVWLPGSFYSQVSATGSPVAGHAFVGWVVSSDAPATPPANQNVVVHARDQSGVTAPGRLYVREKKAGVWGPWGIDGSGIAGDTPPLGPPDGALWWDNESGQLYVYYNDGNSKQWVIASPVPDPAQFLLKAGDTMIGTLGLAAPPVANLDAVNKQYVDGGVAGIPGKVSKAGDVMTGLLTLSGDPTAAMNAATKQYVDASIPPDANLIINGAFRINQVGYVSGAVLSAGTYGHDQWKAGAGGGDYSFTQLKSSTQITITSGKSLIQPIEDVNVVGGSYVLTWTGTAQARAGVNTLTPSGAYAASPLLITGQTAANVMSVEFNNGTLADVNLGVGTIAKPFILRPYADELQACKRYFNWVPYNIQGSSGMAPLEQAGTTVIFSPRMRVAPTISLLTPDPEAPGAQQNTSPNAGGIVFVSNNGGFIYIQATAAGGNTYITGYRASADARL